MRSRVLEVGGIETPVLEAGPEGADEAVVFLHGNPGSTEDWRSLIAATGRLARSVAWDQPGFGRADRPRGFAYDVDGYTRYMEQLLRALGIDRAHLVAHDFGGAWALQWAAEHPDRFASIVLVDTGVLPGYRWHRYARIWRTPLLGELFLAAGPGGPRVFRRAMNRGQIRPLPRDYLDRVLAASDAGYRRAVRRLYRATDDPGEMGHAAIAVLAPLDRPALVLWGARDPYLPAAYAEVQRAAFPRAHVVVLAESGHWPFLDDPDTVERALLAFLPAVLSARAGG